MNTTPQMMHTITKWSLRKDASTSRNAVSLRCRWQRLAFCPSIRRCQWNSPLPSQTTEVLIPVRKIYHTTFQHLRLFQDSRDSMLLVPRSNSRSNVTSIPASEALNGIFMYLYVYVVIKFSLQSSYMICHTLRHQDPSAISERKSAIEGFANWAI